MTAAGLPIKPGKDTENYKIGNMAEAMRLAHERVRSVEDPDPDPYGYVSELEQSSGLDLLEAKWKSKPDDERWNQRLRGRARKAAVAKLYLVGHTVPEMALKLGVSEVTIYRDLDHISREWRKSYLDDIEALAGKDLARMDYMLQRLSPGIDRGDTKSIMAAIEIIKERGSILGYRQGVQVDITQYIREVAEAAGFDPDKAVGLAERIAVTMK